MHSLNRWLLSSAIAHSPSSIPHLLQTPPSPAILRVVTYQITTPEQVSFHYEVAGLISRACAWLIDQVLLWTLRIALGMALGSVLPGGLGTAAALIGYFAVDFGYFVLAELWMTGQTPGKKAFRLRVIADDGTRLTGTAVLIRNLLRMVDTLPMFMVLGGSVALCERHHRRLGDLAAGTLVIREAGATIPTALTEARGRQNTFEADPVVRQRILNRVTRAERDLLYDLMLRRDTLDGSARRQLFARAAAYCRARYNLPTDLEHLSDEQTVLNVALVIHRGQQQAGALPGSTKARRRRAEPIA